MPTNSTPAETPLMSIGLFSRSSLLSVKSLRAYHDQGILIPAVIDPDTGYRSYHPGQLSDATVLSSLRQLDLPLAAVKAILLSRDPEVTKTVLAEHHLLMAERLAETQRIVNELQSAVAHPNEQTPVHVRGLEHHYALAIRTEVPSAGFASFFDQAFPRLFELAMSQNFVITGPGAALYQPVIHDHDSEPVTAYLPVLEPKQIEHRSPDLQVMELPAQTVASLVHRGSYESISSSYANLGSWVAHNGRSVPGDANVREIYVVGPTESEDPKNYRTELCWPVAV